ncbi:MAG: hypothetical protein QOK10_41 [Pseudonocardiales bacterium]|jgi:hypothetical protein|nr:hypothetical protein [Pseudonocardiales bacterium]
MSTKSFDQADETRTPDKTRVDIVRVDGVQAARFSMEPGWKWSECIKPVAGTDTCQAHHIGVVISGTMHVLNADGSEMDAGVGNVYVIEPGHDAWVVGDDTFVGYEFDAKTVETYAAGS